MKGRCVLLLLAVTGIAILSCAAPLKQKNVITPDADYNILIASDGSEFKNAVHDRLIERYRSQCNIENITIDAINKIDSEKYDAVVIMDSCMAWSGFNLAIKKYMSQASARDNLILVMTADDPDWQFNYSGVDAITSASVPENEEKIFTLITMQIDHILTKSNN